MVDLLNPLATIQWSRRGELNCGAYPDVVQFKGKLVASSAHGIWVADSDYSDWKELDAPSHCSSLSTYHSQLVLVGGYINDRPTNKVWVSDDGYSWNTSLPPMPTARMWPTVVNTGTPEYLLVAGGDPSRDKVVEVLMEGQWWSLPSLPYTHFVYGAATIHGRTLHISGVYCDLQALLASRQAPNNTVRSDPDGLWSEFHFFHLFHPVSFQGKLLCSIDNELLVSYDDSLVSIGRAVGKTLNNIGGELINIQGTSSGYCFYTACIEGTIVATVVNAKSLAVFPPTFSVFISS
jgi:hypothetical protein